MTEWNTQHILEYLIRINRPPDPNGTSEREAMLISVSLVCSACFSQPFIRVDYHEHLCFLFTKTPPRMGFVRIKVNMVSRLKNAMALAIIEEFHSPLQHVVELFPFVPQLLFYVYGVLKGNVTMNGSMFLPLLSGARPSYT